MSDGCSAGDYAERDEESCRDVEVVDGVIRARPMRSRRHQRIIRRLSYELESACGSDLAVEFDVDLRLRDVPLLNRRPDLVVYDADLPTDAVLRPEHCRLVVEVMSPGSITVDQIDKPAEYAAAGIPQFWRVENTTDEVGGLTVFCYRLDATTRSYVPTGAHQGTFQVATPVEVSLELKTLL
ncbi:MULTISPECIES: Uma2 family endonuclease [unclassified Amycolatopsis]|uniref:Uma2 family endonuclease n=1 Tax=unclassified Amycolatopsis TaxID=2618356 RepID=UPI00106EA85C|nr:MULTISPECIES: Uma2 family endonuclease [unclassified Amycolatopsis]